MKIIANRKLFKITMDYTIKINSQEHSLCEIETQYMYFLNENRLDQIKKLCAKFKY